MSLLEKNHFTLPFKIHYFLLLCLFNLASLSAQVFESEAMTAPEVFRAPKEEDIYEENGSYKHLVGGKVTITGTFENKKREGEFKYYRKNGQLEKKETYVNGILNGPFSTYTNGRLSIYQEYKNGIKINYEYEFDFYGDTLSVAGPFPGKDLKTGKIMIRQKLGDGNNSYGTQIICYDTLSFNPDKPVFIAHHEFITEQRKVKEHKYTEVSLYENNSSGYNPGNINVLITRAKNFNANFPAYPPSEIKARIRKFDKEGKLYLLSDSGYVLRFNKGFISKDSITIPKEGKVCHAGYNERGQLAFEVRYDTAESNYSTNLYYGANKKLLYEVGSRDYKPTYVKIYDDSVRQASKGNTLFDCFGTAYLFDANKKIDTSFSSAEYKMRMKEKITGGIYFYLPTSPRYPKEGYSVMEINGRKKNEYLLDSTLKPVRDKGVTFQAFQKDTVIYLVKEIVNSYEDHFLIYKYIRKGDKLYTVHNQVKSKYLYTRESMISFLERDSIPVFKSELLTENEFKKALKMKRIGTLSKEEFLKWMERSKNLDPAMSQARDAISLGVGESHDVKAPFSIIAWEVYRMGYNPYFSKEEVEALKVKFNLSQNEISQWRFLFR